MINIEEVWATLSGEPWAIVAALGLGLTAVALLFLLGFLLVRAIKKHVNILRKREADDDDEGVDTFTVLVAVIALAVSSQGMYEVFTNVLKLEAPLNLLFIFLEAGALASAIRARKNVRKYGSAGVDGKAVWVIALISGVFSCLEEVIKGSMLGALIRFIAPLVAAWYWERALSSSKKEFERRTQSGSESGSESAFRVRVLRRIWERVLVALKLADPEGRSLSAATADRYLDNAAKRIIRARWAIDSRFPFREGYRRWRAQKALVAASMNTGLGTDSAVALRLRGKLAAHGALDGLLALELPDLMDVLDGAESASESVGLAPGLRALESAPESAPESGSESALKALPSPPRSLPSRTRTQRRTRTDSAKRGKASKIDLGALPGDRWEAAQVADERHRDQTGRPVSSDTLRAALRCGKKESDALVRMLRERDGAQAPVSASA